MAEHFIDLLENNFGLRGSVMPPALVFMTKELFRLFFDLYGTLDLGFILFGPGGGINMLVQGAAPLSGPVQFAQIASGDPPALFERIKGFFGHYSKIGENKVVVGIVGVPGWVSGIGFQVTVSPRPTVTSVEVDWIVSVATVMAV